MPVDKHQFHLPLAVAQPRPRTLAGSDRKPPERALPQRVAGMDQVLGTTHDIERITGRHRCTIYRWVRAGTFPEKRASGGRGWLKSDVERWLEGAGSSGDYIPEKSDCVPAARRGAAR